MHPTNIPDWRALLLSIEPGEANAPAVYAAQATASPVVATVEVFNALKSAPDLTQPELRLLVGAAHLIAAGGWHGLAGEAVAVVSARAAQIETPPAPVDILPGA